jgi:hypothetical protein
LSMHNPSPRQTITIQTLPQEILHEIYILCSLDIIAVIQQPQRKNISGPHFQRFTFQCHDGVDVDLPLLRICRALREDYTHFIAAYLPLKLDITSYAPSIFIPPHLLLPNDWAQNVKQLKLTRSVGSPAWLSSLLEPFPNLRSVFVGYKYTRRLPLRSPFSQTLYRRMDQLRPILKGTVESEMWHNLVRAELGNSLDKTKETYRERERDFKFGVQLRFGSFTLEGRKTGSTGKRCHAAVSSCKIRQRSQANFE